MDSNDGVVTPGTSRADRWMRGTRLVLLAAAVLVLSSAAGAGAASLITGRQIKDGTVTGRDIRDHSLRPKDAKAGVIRRGLQGPQGPQGLAGTEPGPTGPSGRDGLGGVVTVVSPAAFTIPAQVGGTPGVASSGVECPSGWSALGGGVSGADAGSVTAMKVTRSMPVFTAALVPTGWQVTVVNSSGADIGAFVWTRCAPI